MIRNAESKRTSLKAKIFSEPICKANLKHKGQENIPKPSQRTNEKALYLRTPRLDTLSVPSPSREGPSWLSGNHCPPQLSPHLLLSCRWGMGPEEEIRCRILG